MIRWALLIISGLFGGFLYQIASAYTLHIASLIVVGAIFGGIIAALLGINATHLPAPDVSGNNPASE